MANNGNSKDYKLFREYLRKDKLIPILDNEHKVHLILKIKMNKFIEKYGYDIKQHMWNKNAHQEENNLVDKYGRLLGYLVLADGRILNEIMIKEGFAKPYNEVFCEMLPMYQEWNLQARINQKGLYNQVNKF